MPLTATEKYFSYLHEHYVNPEYMSSELFFFGHRRPLARIHEVKGVLGSWDAFERHVKPYL